jgi:acetyltransferase-like isoleucine patch superfamily enzyme
MKKARCRKFAIRRKPKIQNLISPTAKIGRQVQIWNYAYVGANAEIGDRTKIGSLAHVDYDVKIGSNCKIEGLAYLPPKTEIGDNVFIGPSAVLTNDPYPLSDKLVGVTVEDGAIICARAVIKAGLRIGRNSVVGMGAVVTKDVPPEVVVTGCPARVVYSRTEYEKKRRAWNQKLIYSVS